MCHLRWDSLCGMQDAVTFLSQGSMTGESSMPTGLHTGNLVVSPSFLFTLISCSWSLTVRHYKYTVHPALSCVCFRPPHTPPCHPQQQQRELCLPRWPLDLDLQCQGRQAGDGDLRDLWLPQQTGRDWRGRDDGGQQQSGVWPRRCQWQRSCLHVQTAVEDLRLVHTAKTNHRHRVLWVFVLVRFVIV